MKGSPQDKPKREILSQETTEILERITDAFFVIDGTGSVTYVNKQAEKVFKKRRNDLIGKNLDTIYPEAIGTEFDIQAQKVLTTLQPTHFEAFFKPLSLWIEISMYPFANGISIYFQDITKRKEIEHEKQLQATILQNMQEGVIALDKNGNVTFWNKGAEKLYGYKSQEVIGQPIGFLYPETQKENFKDYITQMRKGEIFLGEVQRKTKHKGLIWVELYSSFIYGKNGDVLGTVGISRDITQEKKAEERIQYLANLITHTSDAVISTDNKRNIVSWNKAAEIMYGWKEKEVLGKQASHILAIPKDIPYKENIYQQVFTEGVWKGEVMHKKKDDTLIPIYATVSSIVDAQGNTQGLVSINTDISERKALEERKNDFIAMASHELKTPLTSLRIYTQLFAKILPQDEVRYVTYLRKMENDLDRLQQLVTDLLDISKMQQGRLPLQSTQFDICLLIKETVEFIRIADSKHPIIIKPLKKITVWGDREKINQVMINLLSNAAKYSPEESLITIYVTQLKDSVQVKVTDKGIGIAKKYQEDIFEHFFRITDKKELQTYEGLGIGLYICREIIKTHGGKMWVKSTEGKGSTFYFTLPLKQQDKS